MNGLCKDGFDCNTALETIIVKTACTVFHLMIIECENQYTSYYNTLSNSFKVEVLIMAS